MIQGYFNEAANAPTETAVRLCFQSFGDFLRFNPHWHAIALEGGFNDDGNVVLFRINIVIAKYQKKE